MRERAGFDAAFRLTWYPGRYDAAFRSIFAVGDVTQYVPDCEVRRGRRRTPLHYPYPNPYTLATGAAQARLYGGTTSGECPRNVSRRMCGRGATWCMACGVPHGATSRFAWLPPSRRELACAGPHIVTACTGVHSGRARRCNAPRHHRALPAMSSAPHARAQAGPTMPATGVSKDTTLGQYQRERRGEAQADAAILEEPEHLTWFHFGRLG